MEQIEEQYTGPRVLPQVRIGEKIFTIDLRLREFREPQKPWLNVPFDSKDGRILCQQANIVGCKRCRTYSIVPGDIRDNELFCCYCGECL
jgi:hypothetical protein